MSRVVAARAPGCSIAYIDGVETTRDPCAVVTDGLASVVQRFVDDYGRRASRAGADGDRKALVAGAIQELVRRTRDADPTGRGVSDKTIRSVLTRSYATTDLRTADALLTATRRVDLLQNGTIQIVQNERAAASVRTTCCSGSEWTPAPTYAVDPTTGVRTLREFDSSLNGAA